ncbi:uncharacterized protein LOC122664925 isoform X2 [Telopea speciosissima]|uniref:uncharacterized protein LOC122664925 isoform X2 n=1 Tax=Telopea speciosissima TaxID=54955 RepID=UPI001CC53EC7|nr:uncharacterized protein LOC122664925 isoform X2 [Telopea speciosissima]
MSFLGWAKKELTKLGIYKSKKLLLSRSSLASIESLSVPLIQEVVLSADLGCKNCQKRVAHAISLMDLTTDSMVVDILEKKVTLTCISSIKGSKKASCKYLQESKPQDCPRYMY